MLVCTDAAARGLDLPNVTHIVQADFASSAIDFLHRVDIPLLIHTYNAVHVNGWGCRMFATQGMAFLTILRQ